MNVRLYELIDTTDNSCYDTGTYVDMLQQAIVQNDYDRRELCHIAGLKPNRWQVKPEGYSERNYREGL